MLGGEYCIGGARVEPLMDLQEAIKEIDDSITKAEAELLQNAPDNIKTLYLRIDFLCCKQNALKEKLLMERH
jgi:RNA binding exosome subunit